MYQEIDTVELKTGERVPLGVVDCPDIEWAPRLKPFLGHKREIFCRQIHEFLTAALGVEIRFYILHRQSDPLSVVMTAVQDGVGILGHVYTKESERGRGCATAIFSKLIPLFCSRGGKALFLTAGFESDAYKIYQKFGFTSVQPQSGHMSFYSESEAEYSKEYFPHGDTYDEPLDWKHWPGLASLFLSDSPDLVRCANFNLFGRKSSEGPLLPLIVEETERKEKNLPARSIVLRQSKNHRIVGFATWREHPIWPETCLVDLFCHSHFQNKAGALLAKLQLPSKHRCLAYTDELSAYKQEVLQQNSFLQIARLPSRLYSDPTQSSSYDVLVFEKPALPSRTNK